jgi:hypothetical protein
MHLWAKNDRGAVLAFLQQQASKGGKIGGKRSLKTMTAAERTCPRQEGRRSVSRRPPEEGHGEEASLDPARNPALVVNRLVT